jgi:4-hydroxyphenylpyruvate dioxygenase
MVTKAKTASASRPMTEEADFLQIKSVDHVHFYVGNAKHAMYYWWKAFGFKPVAYSGLETGNRDFASYVLESGQARFVVSAPYSPSSPLASHHMVHGDGVKVIALEVDDVEKAWQATTSRGGKSAWAPREEKDDYGIYRTSAIYTTAKPSMSSWTAPITKAHSHLLTNRSNYETQSTGLAAIDHIVGNVQLGKMNHWVNFYHQVMGFRQLMHFDDKDISTEYSALMSKVMQNGNGRVKFPINEPAEGKRKSQIEEYLDYYLTPGAQHLAIITGDILTTIEKLRKNGVEFLRVP